ncbi:glycosyltransferase [Azospirillum rugosum]|uniref:GT2 family glycosyltransferase/glycosyltransferase involved in cell wall biosynthesis n=1 Tax=Azospirillum rugosum TaxID=416170 RepID=A0ABS4SSB2_9PROT|nr:glycosyltransferase [Azospirillum rugosum]MBP2294280.1 GT2 family glycosyltransferase/glycosyltransferase involved in cell wall biosynthesis [Azospirillum rugosum]MDQ0527615.1 GT2 family glycosyltransferase/glycosyltransferase involved in cell wall biosynthesis [Azospirillum rugosum]
MSSSKKPKPDPGPLERAIADGRWAEAEREARALLRDDRSHSHGATGLARCAIARGDLGEALRWAERSARFAPNDIALKAFFAALLVAADRPGDVPPLLESVAERAPTPTASIVLGQALARLGAMDRFVPLVERLLHRFPVGVAPMLADLADHALRSGAAAGWASADLGLRIVGALHPDRIRAGSVLRVESGRGSLLALDGPSFLHRYGQPDPAAGVIRFTLPLGPEAEGETLSVTLDGRPLLGAPLHPRRHAAVEGSAVIEDAADGNSRLSGWAWCPGDPPQRVTVRVSDSAGRSVTLATDRPMEAAQAFGIEDGDYAFTLDLDGSGLEPGLLRVTAGPGDVPLAGSPLPWPGPGRDKKAPERRPTPVEPPPARRPQGRLPSPIVDVIVPVYRGREETLACLRSVFAAAREDRTPHEVIVIDDAGPEPDLARDLAALAAAGRITLLRNERNLGFPATVNRGLGLHPDRDVVLLNADTLVAGDWLARLRAAAHGSHDAGTVTPLSNDATILSYPSGTVRPPAPTLDETARLDRTARAVNTGVRAELPVGVGFCLYIRRDCLEETGPFEERLFGRGYGEENDFCLRARRLGWRHLGAADVFVAHVGGRSFGRQKAILAARNGRLLERLHPGYDALVQDFIAADPLLAARRRLDLARWAAEEAAPRPPAVLLVTLSGRGGVARFVAERIAALRAEGWRVLRLSPETGEDPDAPPDEDGPDDEDEEDGAKADPPERRCRIEVTDRPDLRDLVFRTRAEFDELVAALRQAGTAAVEIHHTLGHDPAVLDLAGRLGVPYDVTVHDYGLICPRVNLVDGAGRYCGEPDLAACERCTADPDDRADPDLTVTALRRRTRALVAGARRVTVPTRDVAARLARHTDLLHMAPRPIDVRPWEAVEPPRGARPQRPPGGRWRVCTIGAVGIQKGYEVLLACARDAAARDLPLEFVVVGFSEEDPPLFETGRIFVTGRFSEEEAVALVRAQQAHLAFLPSISPETWCYALSTAWRAGLEVAAFDLGALGERIRSAGGGHRLPLGLDPATINDTLLGILDARTVHGVAIERPTSFRPDNRPSGPMTDLEAPVHDFSTFHARGGSSMIGSVASAEATQSSQIKATAQTLPLAPGFYSLIVTGGGSAAAPGEFPLPSVQLAAAPNGQAGVTVEMISSVPGNWLAKPGDTIIIKVAGGTANLILSSYKHIDRTNALLSLQFARIDDVPGGAAQPAAAAPAVGTPAVGTPAVGTPAAAAPVAPAPVAAAPVATPVVSAPIGAARAPRAEILAHVQRHGDLRFADSNWAGAVGQRLWIEAFSITPVDGLSPEDIEYKGLTANGWETPWITGGNMCGSRGLGTPLIGFSIRLRGAVAERFECVYEGAFVSGYRSPAGQNGSPCRSDAIGDPLEGILLRLVEKQGALAQPRSF